MAAPGIPGERQSNGRLGRWPGVGPTLCQVGEISLINLIIIFHMIFLIKNDYKWLSNCVINIYIYIYIFERLLGVSRYPPFYLTQPLGRDFNALPLVALGPYHVHRFKKLGNSLIRQMESNQSKHNQIANNSQADGTFDIGRFPHHRFQRQVFRRFITADECPGYWRWRVLGPSFRYHSVPVAVSTQHHQQMGDFLCSFGFPSPGGPCAPSPKPRSKCYPGLLRYLFLRRIDPSAVEGIPWGSQLVSYDVS